MDGYFAALHVMFVVLHVDILGLDHLDILVLVVGVELGLQIVHSQVVFDLTGLLNRLIEVVHGIRS